MDNFFALFRRYLNNKAKGNEVYVPRRRLRAIRGQSGSNRVMTGIGIALPLPLKAR